MVVMMGSSRLRWAALAALAALAAADFLAQYVVAATRLASVLHLPLDTVDFLNVGLYTSCDVVRLWCCSYCMSCCGSKFGSTHYVHLMQGASSMHP